MKLVLLSVRMFLITIFVCTKYTECLTKEIITNPKQDEQNPLHGEGFGSQFQTIIASVVYAELNHKEYVYTPFCMMAHNYNNAPDFIVKKEQFINFISNFETINNVPQHYPIKSDIPYKKFFDAHISQCANSDSLHMIKRIFRENKNINNHFNNKNLNIAIHVRRHNMHDNRLMGTDTPNKLFLHVIDKLRIIYSDKNPLFHIFSQGKYEEFTLFESPDSLLHINESIEDTFLGMVVADVLVTGASSFSYTAGLLSEGTVYYIPFWHQPLPHWISIESLFPAESQ